MVQWELSSGHLVSWLENYGGQAALLCRRGEGRDRLCLPALTAARGPPFPLPFLLARGLRFIKDILR